MQENVTCLTVTVYIKGKETFESEEVVTTQR